MSAFTTHKITRLEFKHGGDDEDGHLIGKSTDQDVEPVCAGGPKQDALRIARDLGIELLEY
jgi:hypothetical protein